MLGYRILNKVGVDRAGITVNIDKDRQRMAVGYDIDSRDERPRRGDDLVARAYAQTVQRRAESRSAAVRKDSP